MNEKFYIENETKHLSKDYRTSTHLMDELLDETFIEIGRVGNFLIKPDIINAIPLSTFDYIIENFTVVYTSEEFYQVNYDLKVGEKVLVCTASWIKRDDWKLLFFQGTART